MSDLLKNVEKIHTTHLGLERISSNLDSPIGDVLECRYSAVERAELIMQFGKNWYVYAGGLSYILQK